MAGRSVIRSWCADWTARLPEPVEVPVSERRKVLRTLRDVGDQLLDDLPELISTRVRASA